MSAGGEQTTKQFDVRPRADVIARIDQVRRSRVDFIAQSVAEPGSAARSLRQAQRHDDLSGLLVVKLLQEFPAVGKVAARRLLARLGLDEFVAISELTDDHIETIAAECSR